MEHQRVGLHLFTVTLSGHNELNLKPLQFNTKFNSFISFYSNSNRFGAIFTSAVYFSYIELCKAVFCKNLTDDVKFLS